MLEAVSRQESRAVYIGEQTVLCRVLGKYLMYADAQETGITPHLAMDGYWESWITVALARMLRPGWHCLDVGANHGYYTLIMADAVGPEGRVVPVEPTPRLADLLRQTLDVNGFPSVTVASTAATDTDGQTLQLVIPARRSMNARLVRGRRADRRRGRGRDRDRRHAHPRLAARRPDQDRRRGSGGGRLAGGCSERSTQNPDLVVILELNVERYEDPRSFLEAIEHAGFRLRYIDFDAEVKDVTIDQLLRRRVGEDWMLYLARRSSTAWSAGRLLEKPDLVLQLANLALQLALEPPTSRDLGSEPGFDVRDRRIGLSRKVVEHEELQPQKDALDECDHRADHRLRREAELGSKRTRGTEASRASGCDWSSTPDRSSEYAPAARSLFTRSFSLAVSCSRSMGR